MSPLIGLHNFTSNEINWTLNFIPYRDFVIKICNLLDDDDDGGGTFFKRDETSI